MFSISSVFAKQKTGAFMLIALGTVLMLSPANAITETKGIIRRLDDGIFNDMTYTSAPHGAPSLRNRDNLHHYTIHNASQPILQTGGSATKMLSNMQIALFAVIIALVASYILN